MMSPEETRVLEYLRRHSCAAVADVARACLAGASPKLVDRVLTGLEWLGYVAVYRGPDGYPVALQVTQGRPEGACSWPVPS